MNKFIKAGLAILIGASFVTGLAGCGQSKQIGGGNITTVTIWTGESHSKAVYDRLINTYNEGEGKEKGIKIDYVVKEGDSITQSIELALQSGQAPDMFSAGSLGKMVENNYLAAIDDLPGSKEFLKKYDSLLIKNRNTYNDKVYTVPFSAATQGLIYNKDMFRAAGIVDENGEPTPPETFEELREYAKKLTNPGKREYGIILPVKYGGWYSSDITSPMMSSAGHEGYNPATGEYDLSVLVPIMNTFLGIKADGSFFPGADGLDNDQARAHFAEGGIGMKFAFSFDVGVLNDQFPAEIDWGVAPYPVVDKNKKFKQRMDYADSYFMNAKSFETVGGEKMMEVLKYFTGDQFITDTYIEGVNIPYDWNIVKDVKIDNPKKGWVDFCKMVSISVCYPRTPAVDMTGQIPLKERFLNDVWTGKLSPSTVVDDYTNAINKGRDKYYEDNKDKDVTEFINKDWNIER